MVEPTICSQQIKKTKNKKQKKPYVGWQNPGPVLGSVFLVPDPDVIFFLPDPHIIRIFYMRVRSGFNPEKLKFLDSGFETQIVFWIMIKKWKKKLETTIQSQIKTD